MSATNEPLLPCPFCGSPASDDSDLSADFASCSNRDCCASRLKWIGHKWWNTRAPAAQTETLYRRLPDGSDVERGDLVYQTIHLRPVPAERGPVPTTREWWCLTCMDWHPAGMVVPSTCKPGNSYAIAPHSDPPATSPAQPTGTSKHSFVLAQAKMASAVTPREWWINIHDDGEMFVHSSLQSAEGIGGGRYKIVHVREVVSESKRGGQP